MGRNSNKKVTSFGPINDGTGSDSNSNDSWFTNTLGPQKTTFSTLTPISKESYDEAAAAFIAQTRHGQWVCFRFTFYSGFYATKLSIGKRGVM